MNLRTGLLAAAMLLITTLAVATTTAQADFDPVAGPYPYDQPDAAGDSTGAAAAPWGDIIALRATTLADGGVLFQMEFADLAMTTGELRYCIFFEVDGTAYQTGYRGQMINGAPNGAPTSCTWNNSGETVGTPAIDTANDIITIAITAEELGEPAFGTPLEAIEARIGAVVPVAGQGSTSLFDSLSPSIEPLDFAYGLGAAPPDPGALSLSAADADLTAAVGNATTFAISVRNDGQANATFNATVEGLPADFDAAIDPAGATLAQNETAALNLTIQVPAEANTTSYAFVVRVESTDGANATLNLTLVVQPAIAGSPTDAPTGGNDTTDDNGTAASAEEGGGVPGPGVIAAMAALATAFVAARVRRDRR